ncbi:MAG TPA: ABC transporter ATP-binding protein [Candidatus Eremiobacteraceae bacterium]|nr:ABC transporter ATP-binding protein [Candidatus Eremiobacteraceae bacterium]
MSGAGGAASGTNGAALLDVRDLRAGYGGVEAVHGISLRLEQGRVATIIGANGAGKTTTLLAISGIVRASAGTIELSGRRISGLEPHDIVAAGLVQVPEGRLILAQMSVRENLQVGAFTRRDRAQIAADVESMFQRFPVLRERADVAAGSLSGGEQQMLAIARGLMARPKLLLLDEPSMGLAPLLVAQIFAIIKQLRAEGLSILLVEQNARQALAISDYAYVLERGNVVKQGASPDIAGDAAVAAAYLGG